MTDILHPGFGVAALIVALATAWMLSVWLPIETKGRNISLDGLRGYMAFGVFLYHSVIWFSYLRTGSWNAPATSLYRPLGDLCVKMFFMITAYLFIGKIIDSRDRPIDWCQLYVSRILRLAPLYLLALAGLLTMTGILTDWTLHESSGKLLEHIGQWLAFTMVAAPDVNRLPETSLLVAGVTWSLAYEWLFYFSLPALTFVLLRPVRLRTAIFYTCILLILLLIKPNVIFPWSFVFGAVAAVIARTTVISVHLRGPTTGLVVCAVTGLIIGLQDMPIARASTLALTAVFIPVACGNSIFGVLTNRAALLLGEVSYGIYLLHGLLLSVIFYVVLGPSTSRALSPWEHWAVVIVAGSLLVVLSCLTYKVIEHPCVRLARHVAARLSNVGVRMFRWKRA